MQALVDDSALLQALRVERIMLGVLVQQIGLDGSLFPENETVINQSGDGVLWVYLDKLWLQMFFGHKIEHFYVQFDAVCITILIYHFELRNATSMFSCVQRMITNIFQRCMYVRICIGMLYHHFLNLFHFPESFCDQWWTKALKEKTRNYGIRAFFPHQFGSIKPVHEHWTFSLLSPIAFYFTDKLHITGSHDFVCVYWK